MAASHRQYVRSEPHVLAMWQTCTYFYPCCRFIVPLSPLFPPLSFGSLFSPSPPDRLSPLSLPLSSLLVCIHPCSVAELGGRLPDDLASGPTNPPFTQLVPSRGCFRRPLLLCHRRSGGPFSESQATVKLSSTALIFNRASWVVESQPAWLEFQNISAARREALPQQIPINSSADNVTFFPDSSLVLLFSLSSPASLSLFSRRCLASESCSFFPHSQPHPKILCFSPTTSPR